MNGADYPLFVEEAGFLGGAGRVRTGTPLDPASAVILKKEWDLRP